MERFREHEGARHIVLFLHNKAEAQADADKFVEELKAIWQPY
jgi:hypothetical protein